MNKQSLTVFDVAEQTYNAGASLSSESGAASWSVTHRRLQGGWSDGVDLIELNNGALSLSIVPTRGMGIWKGIYQGIPLGWQSPVRQVVNPAFVDLNDRNGLGWLAGFNEWLCRCGLAFNGPPGEDVLRDENGKEIARSPVTLHGRMANCPAHRVEMEADPQGNGTLAVTGVVDETSMFGPCLRLTSRIETELGANRFRILDTITNLAGQPAEVQLLYHTNIGQPFVEAGAQLVAPAIEVFPRDGRAAEGIGHWNTYSEPEAGYAEQAYFLKLAADETDNTEVLLQNAAGDRGLGMSYSVKQLPYFTLWKNTVAEADGYVTGLEPALNLPNFKTFEREQGRVLRLPPGQSYATQIEISIYDSASLVREVKTRIENLRSGQDAKIHNTPQKGMSPVD